VQGTGETTGHVVPEHFCSAFAGAIDRVAAARPAMKSDAAFMDLLPWVFVDAAYNHRKLGSQLGKIQNRPLLISNWATEGRNRPVPRPLGTPK
jgi:hypothetical protein